MDKLAGRVAVITGGAKGMGYGCAKIMAGYGALVVLISHSDDVFQAAEKLRLGKEEVMAFNLDVRDRKGLEEACKKTVERYGKIDILVNAAGIGVARDFINTEETDINLVMDINFKGTWNCCKAVIPYMVNAKYGKIVNFASVTGCMVVDPNMTSYASSKGAIMGLTKALASEFASKNITVNAILPGGIDTPMIDKFCQSLCPNDPESVKAAISANVPMKRMGTIEEAGEVAAFLASFESSYVTGTAIVLDGGGTLPESPCVGWETGN